MSSQQYGDAKLLSMLTTHCCMETHGALLYDKNGAYAVVRLSRL